jgi:DNA-binding response OmpR family regulator
MHSRTILIVDDDLTSLDLIDLLFDRAGFQVIKSVDGKSALETLNVSNPDIILIDLMMPGMNGKDCIEKVRASGINVPIIAFTALQDPGYHLQTMSVGADIVLTKPCKPEKLIKHVNKLLGISS